MAVASDLANVLPLTAEERLVEWVRSEFHEPWNYWPPTSVLGRIKDEGAGASQGTDDGDPDGGLGALIDRLAPKEGQVDGIALDRRCAEVREAYYRMPPEFSLIVDATYRGWPSKRDPRSWQASVAKSGLKQATYFRRKRAMLEWLESYLCIPKRDAKAA